MCWADLLSRRDGGKVSGWDRRKISGGNRGRGSTGSARYRRQAA